MLWRQSALCAALRDTLLVQYPLSNVTLVCLPTAEWHQQVGVFNGSFLAACQADVLVIDSAWIGAGYASHQIHNLSDVMESLPLQDFFSVALSAAADFPPNASAYYAVPLQGDVPLLAFRRDLLDAAFAQNASMFPLGFASPPTTIVQLVDLSEYAVSAGYTPYGLAAPWCGAAAVRDGACYGGTSNAFNSYIFTEGGELFAPLSLQVAGVLNASVNVATTLLVQRLFATFSVAEDVANESYAIGEYCAGRAMFLQLWASSAGSLLRLDGPCADYANLTQFTVFPGNDVAVTHSVQFRGDSAAVWQGSRNVAAAKQLLAWLQTELQQQTYMTLPGALSVRKSAVLNPTFLFSYAAGWGALYGLSMASARGSWNVNGASRLIAIEVRRRWRLCERIAFS